MLDRIQELLAVRELSSSQFADAIGVSRPVVSHLLSGRNKPSLEVVQKIIAAFPDLSLNWLLNGSGSMLEQPVPPTPAAARPTAPISDSAPPVRAEKAAAEKLPVARSGVVEPPLTHPPTPEPVLPPASASGPVLSATPTPRATPATPAVSVAPPTGAEIAHALAEPGKTIRRIVFFYQDGTFADFRPEAG